MRAIVRIALAEFAKAFAFKVGTPAARDFLWLTVFFTLSAFIVFVGWSARDGVWDRFEQVLLGALPEGGPPIRVATHIDLPSGITPPVIDKFERDFPGLGIVPMREFDGTTGAVTLPGLALAYKMESETTERHEKKSREDEDKVDAELSWGRARDGATARFRSFAIPMDSPLWRWIRQHSGDTAGVGDRAPLVIAANRSLFQKHFRYERYRAAIAADYTAPCGMRSRLPADISDPAQLDTLVLKLRELSHGIEGREAFHSFKVIWVDSFPLPEQVAFIMPLQTAEIAMAADTWKDLEIYFEGQGAASQRVSELRLKDIDALSGDNRTRAVAEFRKVAACLGAVPVEQIEETTVCGTKWLPRIVNDSVVASQNTSKRAVPAGDVLDSKVPLLALSDTGMSITTSPEWPLRKHDVQQCLQGMPFAAALNPNPPPAQPGDVVADFTPDSAVVEWKGLSRIELPCKVLTVQGTTLPLLEQGSCPPTASGEPAEGARGIGRLPGYTDAMIYAGATNKAGKKPGTDNAPVSGSLDDVVRSLLDWKVDAEHHAFRLDAAYESALVRFGVLSTIVDKMSLPLGGGMLVLYLVLSGVILATTFLHRRSQYGLLFMNGVRPWRIAVLIFIQIALGCTIGCVIGYAGFMIVASEMNMWLKASDIIHKAAFIIGLDVPTFLDNLTLLNIVSIWISMTFAGFAIASIILRIQGISIAKAPIDLIKS